VSGDSDAPLQDRGTWVVDPAHSRVGFAVTFLGISTVRGAFERFQGTFRIDGDLIDAKIGAEIEVASIHTGQARRDAHLLSSDFFDARQFPTLSFVSTQIAPLADDRFTIVGNLTMHGVTRPVKIEATALGSGLDPWGNERLGLELHGELSRDAFGISFNFPLDGGKVAISDTVELVLDVSVIKQGASRDRVAGHHHRPTR
jgi:polyisoprenoid-binding protein YceI